MDIELFYREKGSGEPLILLHGNGEDGSGAVPEIDSKISACGGLA